MSDVVIRDIPPEDVARLEAAAAGQCTSLDAYLVTVLYAQAVHLRRQDGLRASATRLGTRPAVPSGERDAVGEASEPAVGETYDAAPD